MVRRRVEIKPIDDKSKRHTTFTKRRHGLFKKAQDLCDLCGSEAAVIAFSKAGNGFGFGHPAVGDVLNRYLAEPGSILAKEPPDDDVEERAHGGGSGIERGQEAPPPLTEVEKKISEAVWKGRPAWEATLSNLGLSELNELEAAAAEIKRQVAERVRDAAASGGQGNIP